MYLRTTKRTNKDGTVVEYYQLAHNHRHKDTKQPVAQVIHNFGRADELDREELTRLCRSIARVCGLTVVDTLPEAPEQFEMLTGQELGLPSEMKLLETVDLGSVLVIDTIWEWLGLGKTFRSILERRNRKVPYERALLAMTANRLCEPESKLGVWDRWLEKVYLPSCAGLKLAQMYEAMDLLYEHSTEIEEAVFHTIADLMNLEVDLIFYDTTTATFSIDYEDEDTDEAEAEDGLRKYGHPKDGTWAPQVVVALAVTREGIPVRSWIFPGNTSDVTTVKKVKEDLKGWKLGRTLFVADAGMNSEDNRRELGKACGKYLLAVRAGSVSEVKKEVLTKRGRYKQISENLSAKEVQVGDGERRRRYILCYNRKEAERQRKHREEVVKLLEKELKKHPVHKATAQWAIELLASRRYKRYLTVTKGGKIRIDRGAVREAKKLDGKWVLMTNDDTISIDDAAQGYKGLLVIERCFRSLKRTQIKMTPMYHWLSRRIEAHVKICVLALMIERVVELKYGKPWARIRRHLSKLQATKCRVKNFEFFNRNEPPAEVRDILKKLTISMPKLVLGVSKTD